MECKERSPKQIAWLESCGLAADAQEARIAYGDEVLAVNVDDVLIVRDGLARLQSSYPDLWRRTVVLSRPNEDMAPADAMRRLAWAEHGSLTDATTGAWLPGRREIVCVLTSTDSDDGFAAMPFIIAQ